MERVSFDPILPANSKIFILGTKLRKQFLRKQQYYANNRNSFWKIIYELTAAIFTENYVERTAVLKRNHIAIWDICPFGERKTSLASDIKNRESNPINEVIEMFPSMKQILFNKKKAEKLYRNYFSEIKNIQYKMVLSTSPANPRFSFREKLNNWKTAMV
jgi:hypoxanthine-DNA glycosylase